MKSAITARVTLWVNRAIFALVCSLLFLMPSFLRWYQNIRPLVENSVRAISLGFYLCAPTVLWALWTMDLLLRSILAGDVFVTENVRRIRQIRVCCAVVSLICLVAARFYPPLIFLTVIMAFLALVVTVVGQVMKAAVEIREENDLTV